MLLIFTFKLQKTSNLLPYTVAELTVRPVHSALEPAHDFISAPDQTGKAIVMSKCRGKRIRRSHGKVQILLRQVDGSGSD